MGQNLGKTASALSKTKGELDKKSSFLAELMGVPGVRELANDLAERSASELYTASAEAPKPQEPGESEQPAQQAAEKLDPLPSAPELGDTTDTTKNSQTSTETTPAPPAVPTPVNIPAAPGAAATAATAAPAIPPPPPPPAKRAGGPPPPPPPPPPNLGKQRGEGEATDKPPAAQQEGTGGLAEQLAKKKANLQSQETERSASTTRGDFLADIAKGAARKNLRKPDPNSPHPSGKCKQVGKFQVCVSKVDGNDPDSSPAQESGAVPEHIAKQLLLRFQGAPKVTPTEQASSEPAQTAEGILAGGLAKLNMAHRGEDDDDGDWPQTPRSSFGNRRRFL